MTRFRTAALAASLLLSTFVALPCRAADGDFDPAFGDGGIAYLTPDLVAAQELQPVAAIVLPDGKLLFGGSLDAPTTVPFEQEYRGMLARFNADGTADTSFGNTSIPGVVALPNLVEGNRLEGIESMQRLDDGSIIAAGVSSVNSPERGFIVKLDADGNLDPAFADGGVVLIPGTYLHAVGIDSEGRIVVSTYPERAKARNAKRDPRVSFCVLSDEWDGPYVHVEGRAEVLDLPEALDPLVEYFRGISGEHPDWDDYRAAMVRQGKCLIRVEPTRWGPVSTGGFPARLA